MKILFFPFVIVFVLSGCQSQNSSNDESKALPADSNNNWEAIAFKEPCGCMNTSPEFDDTTPITFKIDSAAKTISYEFNMLQLKGIQSAELRLAPCGKSVVLFTEADLVAHKNKDKVIKNTLPVSLDKSTSGEVRLLLTSEKPSSLTEIIASLNQDSINRYVTSLYGVRNRNTSAGLEKLEDTKMMIRDFFSRYGLTTSLLQHRFAPYTAQNVIGKIQGRNPNLVIVVGAHFDTVSESPGADDNASGVAAMLEISRVLSAYSFEASIVFVAFDLEEDESVGSYAFVNFGGLHPTDSVIGCINMDMIGYRRLDKNTQTIPDNFERLFSKAYEQVKRNQFRGDFMVKISNVQSSSLSQTYDDVVATYVPTLKVISLEVEGNGEKTKDLRVSDHSSFWDAGIPAISLGDGANTRNPHYHSTEDKLDDVDFDFLYLITKATAGTVAEIAKIRSVETLCKKVTFTSGKQSAK
jgi:hypothetical protein